MKLKLKILALILVCSYSAYSQKVSLESPNQKIKVELFSGDNSQTSEWFLKVFYNSDSSKSEILPKITLGLSRNDQDFFKELTFLKSGKPFAISKQYSKPLVN